MDDNTLTTRSWTCCETLLDDLEDVDLMAFEITELESDRTSLGQMIIEQEIQPTNNDELVDYVLNDWYKTPPELSIGPIRSRPRLLDAEEDQLKNAGFKTKDERGVRTPEEEEIVDF